MYTYVYLCVRICLYIPITEFEQQRRLKAQKKLLKKKRKQRRRQLRRQVGLEKVRQTLVALRTPKAPCLRILVPEAIGFQ